MTFSLGQQIRCVNPYGSLIEGNVYTVSWIGDGNLNEIVSVLEVDHDRNGYYSNRFEPMDPNWIPPAQALAP